MHKITPLNYKRRHLLAISAGIALVAYLPTLPNAWILLGVTCSLFLLGVRYSWFRLPTLFCFGLYWSTSYGVHGLAARLPMIDKPIDLEVVGFVQDIPQTTEQGQRFTFVVESTSQEKSLALRKLSLSTYTNDLLFHASQRAVLTVRIKPPGGFKNNGGFDYEAWLFEQGIDAVGYVKSAHFLDTSSNNSWAKVNLCREWLRDRIIQFIPESSYRGVISALTIGDGSAIDNEQWRVFNRTSTSHLIAISGLHISMIAAFCYAFVSFCGRRFLPSRFFTHIPLQKIAGSIALLVTIFYSLLTGMSIPTQRTLIMLSVSLAALLINQRVKPSVLLCIALCAVLLWDPLAVISAGFWLSFIAVGALLFGLTGRLGSHSLRQWCAAQWIIFVGLIPVMGLCLHQLSLIGPIANIAAVPMISFLVTPLCLLGALLSPVYPFGATQLWQGADFLLALLWRWLLPLSDFENATIMLPHKSVLQWILFSVGIFFLMLPRGWLGRWWGLLAFTLLLLPSPQVTEHGDAKISVLDVGQGLAVVVATREHVLIYDAGPRLSDKLDAGASAVVPYLRYEGISGVDKLIISHADNDHSGGMSSIMQDIEVAQVMTGSMAKIKADTSCDNSQRWEWDGVAFEILWPVDQAPPQDKENNQSCVLKISVGGHAALLTGDIEKPVEYALSTSLGSLLSSDLLIAPHHGSKTSSTLDFVRLVNPAEVVFSSGYLNRFGHPHPEVVNRYAQQGADWFNTAQTGGIIYRLSASGLAREAIFRESHKRYWDGL